MHQPTTTSWTCNFILQTSNRRRTEAHKFTAGDDELYYSPYHPLQPGSYLVSTTENMIRKHVPLPRFCAPYLTISHISLKMEDQTSMLSSSFNQQRF